MSLPAASEREQVPSELKAMADLDVAQLEAITPHVTTQLQVEMSPDCYLGLCHIPCMDDAHTPDGCPPSKRRKNRIGCASLA